MREQRGFERSVLGLARRWWWLLVIAVAVAGSVGYFITSRVDSTYESSTRLLVGPVNTDRDSLGAAGLLAQTYAELATSRPLLEQTIEELDLSISPDALRADIQVVANDTTRFLTVTAQGGDPALPAAVSNSVADNLVELSSRGASRPEGRLQVIDRALPPGQEIRPPVALIVALAAVAGLIGALGLVFLIEYFSDSVKNERELTELASVSVLGSFDGLGSRLRSSLAVERAPDSRAADAYRLIAAKIELSNGARPLRTLLVLGTDGDDGSGSLAANIALVLAERGKDVTLVDVNAHDAEITHMFDLDGQVGCTELLQAPNGGSQNLERVRVKRGANLRIIPRGVTRTKQLGQEAADRFLTDLLGDTDLVVLNTESVDRSSSSLVWARVSEGTVLVAQRDHTSREKVESAVQSLRQVGANLVGTALCGRRRV